MQELLAKECHISAFESFLDQLPITPTDEEYVAKDREVNLLRYKQKLTDSQKEQMSSQLSSLGDEVNQLKLDLDAEKNVRTFTVL